MVRPKLLWSQKRFDLGVLLLIDGVKCLFAGSAVVGQRILIPPVLYSLCLRNQQINEPIRIRRRKAEFPDEGSVRAPISEFGFGMAHGARPRQIPQKAGSLWNLLGITGRRLRGGPGRRRTPGLTVERIQFRLQPSAGTIDL